MNNKKEIAVKEDSFLADLKNTQEACKLLMQTPHYQKLGQDGIFAIIQTAKSLGIDPKLALGGGLYYVRGKVEMSSRMMAGLIRAKKHSITRDGKSNDEICILRGKRADNGDCWTESFSIQEAERAGLAKNATWQNFRRDMLYARALSRLARQLFPDIIGNCYVEGEIALDPNITDQNDDQNDRVKIESVTVEEKNELEHLLDQLPDYKKEIDEFLSRRGIYEMKDIPSAMYEKILNNAKKKLEGGNDEEGNF